MKIELKGRVIEINNPLVKEGYAPNDLISKLKKAGWDYVGNFTGMGLGGCALVNSPDDLCTIKYCITVLDVQSRKIFTIEGYGFDSLLIDAGTEVEKKNKFGGYHLTKKPKDKNDRLFRINIEAK
ncbi:MAG: hypothetical protein HYY86_02315 [Candidatus Harrisonbacteria bacterium]|nr:hypothetical protein [Candidatus Harrisonbacteria bacterium]